MPKIDNSADGMLCCILDSAYPIVMLRPPNIHSHAHMAVIKLFVEQEFQHIFRAKKKENKRKKKKNDNFQQN